MLVAAMNPCPCGYYADPKHECCCTAQQIQKYRSKISGPLLDRIDIHVDVPAVPYKDLIVQKSAETSGEIRGRVTKARFIQSERFSQTAIFANAQMSSRHIKKYCQITHDCHSLLESAVDRLGLSARAFNRILKISRTIADLAQSSEIQMEHLAEAIQYRTLDRGKYHQHG